MSGDLEPAASRNQKIATAVCAALLAFAGVLVAPDAWSDGPARLEIRYQGIPPAIEQLTIGAATDFAFSREDPRDRERTVEVTITGGV